MGGLPGVYMTTVHDIPADLMIEALSANLESDEISIAPDWSKFVKTGIHRERIPTQSNWWAIRSAAVLRKVSIKGPIGVNRLSQEFGGPRDRGVKPNSAAAGSRKIIRTILQQLEANGLIESKKSLGGNVNLGKVVSAKGQSYVDMIAHSSRELAEARYPDLGRY